jgi:hypothetical protein
MQLCLIIDLLEQNSLLTTDHLRLFVPESFSQNSMKILLPNNGDTQTYVYTDLYTVGLCPRFRCV